MRVRREGFERAAFGVGAGVFVASLRLGSTVAVAGIRALLLSLPFVLVVGLWDWREVAQGWRTGWRALLPILAFDAVALAVLQHWTRDRSRPLEDRAGIAFWSSGALTLASVVLIGIVVFRQGRAETRLTLRRHRWGP